MAQNLNLDSYTNSKRNRIFSKITTTPVECGKFFKTFGRSLASFITRMNYEISKIRIFNTYTLPNKNSIFDTFNILMWKINTYFSISLVEFKKYEFNVISF